MSNEQQIRFERLLEVTHALSATLDLEPFLQIVVSAAIELTGSEAASILEYDTTDAALRFLSASWYTQDILRTVKVPVDGSAAGWVYRNVKPLHIPNTKMDSSHYSAADFTAAFETQSLLAVPLLIMGKPLGVLEVVNKASAHYTEEDIIILETLSLPAALAIQNTNLQRHIETSFLELSELDRLKSDFIAITSHELRTPLGLILGHATFLRELLGDEHREQLDVIVKNASRLKEIIESLASVDHYETGTARIHQRSLSVARLIEEAVSSFADMASRRNITLKAELKRDDLYAEADGNKISIAISNLVKNAIMFSDDGGYVLVTGESVPGYIKVSVTDDGIGIPSKDLPRIFDRFFQVESHLTRRHGGMGLGLSVAKAMIEMHGGRIWAESLEGKGSSFLFLLPINPTQTESGSRAIMP